MAIPLKISGAAIQQFAGADELDINSIQPRTGTSLTLGDVGDTVTVAGDLQVDGTQTVTSTATFNGTVNLGDGTGDTINIGGGGTDTVNLLNNLAVGAGAVSIGSSVTDYVLDLWLDIVAGSPADGTNAAVELGANATRVTSGANAIGVATTNLTNSSPGNGDLLTVLEALDAAIGAGGATLQTAYAAGNTISVTAANGTVSFANTTAADATDVLTLGVSGGATGNALSIGDGGTNTTTINAGTINNDGGDLTLSTSVNGAGDGYDIDLTAGAGTTEGGDISITTGAGTAGTGGDLALACSDGTTGGGAIAIFSGDGIGANAAGGSVTVNIGDGFGGATTSPGAGGAFTLTGGAGGDATAVGGFGAAGGAISLTAGDGGDGDGAGGGGNGGNATLRAGNPGANGTPGAGGNVIIEGGNNTGVGGAAAGNVNINTTAGTGNTTIGNATDHNPISMVGNVSISFTPTTSTAALGITTSTTGPVVSLTGTAQTSGGTDHVEHFSLNEIAVAVPAVSIFSVDADPDTDLTAARGSLALDGANGALYVNTSAGATGTTWSAVQTGAGATTLQTAYAGGNTITVTAANGPVSISNAADVTNNLELSRTFAGLGNALDITMGASATGNAIFITDDALVATLSIDPFAIEMNDPGATFTVRAASGTTTAGNVEIAGGSLPTTSGVVGGSVTLQGGQGSSVGPGGNGGLVSIQGGFGNVNGQGGQIDIDAGAGAGAGVGGTVFIDAGTGGTTGAGGLMQIRAGRGGSSGGAGGNMILSAGDAFSGLASGGQATLSGGDGSAVTGGNGGDVNVLGGDAQNLASTNQGGDINITGGIGTGVSGNGGSVDITGGSVSSGGAGSNGGSISIVGGANAANNGGNVFIRGGNGSTNGQILIGDVTTLSITSGPAGSSLRWTHRGLFDMVSPTTAESGINIFEVIEMNSTGTGAQTASLILGDGNPDTNVTSGDVGSLFIDATNANLYQKTANPSTWVAFASGGGNNLQQAYDAGATIATDGSGAITFNKNAASANTGELLTLTDSDTDAAVNTMSITKAPASALTANILQITAGANLQGQSIQISDAGTGSSIFVDKTGGSGNAIQIQDNGTDVFRIGFDGSVNFDPTANTNFDVDATGSGSISLDAAAASNFTVSGAAADLTLGARGATITLNESGETTLDGAFSATSIIGALNELAGGGVSAQQTVSIPIENGVTIAAGDCVAASTVAGRVALMNANADTNGDFIGICVTGGTGDAGGTVDAVIAYAGRVSGLSGLSQGPVYAPDGTGAPTSTAPAGSGDLVFRVGFAYSATEMVIHAGEGVVL